MCTISFKMLKDQQYTFKDRRYPLFVAASFICSSVRNDNDNPFDVREK